MESISRPNEVQTAVILAAGRAARLSSTTERPKCLLPVGGRPILQWILDALAEVGVRRVVLVTGHRAEDLHQALRGLETSLEVTPCACADWELGNGRSAAAAEKALGADARFLLMMSDHLVTAPHLSAGLEAAQADPAACWLVTCSPHETEVDLDDATKVDIDPAGLILAIGKELGAYNGIDTGVFVMTAALFPALAAAHASGGNSLTDGNRRLIAQRQLRAARLPAGVGWQDVDTAIDLDAAEQLVASGRWRR